MGGGRQLVGGDCTAPDADTPLSPTSLGLGPHHEYTSDLRGQLSGDGAASDTGSPLFFSP